MQNECSGKDKRRVTRQQRLVAMVCAVTVWFSFNLGDSLYAAQRRLSVSAPALKHTTEAKSGGIAVGGIAVEGIAVEGIEGHGVAGEALTNGIALADGSGLVAAAISVFVVSLVGYSLLTAGKQGRGWLVVCIVAGLILFVGKLGLAMFTEVSASNYPSDWDEG